VTNKMGPYNLYWLALLVCSTLVMSLIAVVIPAVFQKRHHNGLRAVSEFLARHQLGIVGYYFAILLASDFPPQKKWVQLLICGLIAITFGCVVVGARWASTSAQETLLRADHSCPPTTEEKCNVVVQTQTKWRLCRFNLGLFVLTFVFAVLLPFLIGAPPNSRYVGTWTGHIDWNSKWAEKLFNYYGKSPLELANPRSDGTLYIFKNTQGTYECVSLWDLKNGPDSYADVAVGGEDFQFDAAGKLGQFDLRTLFRSQIRKYDYAPQFHYFIQFQDVSDSKLKGRMMVYLDGQPVLEAGNVVFQIR